MQTHDLRPKNSGKTKKRIARGGKRGTTAGRGTKGQKSRAGRAPRPAVRDFLQRLPKLRGHSNNPKSAPYAVLNLDALTRLPGTDVSLATLREAGIVKKTDGKVKLLGRGDVTKAYAVAADVVTSASAAEKIKKAGGSIATT